MSDDTGRYVTAPRQIAHILAEVRRRHLLLTIGLGGTEELFTSTLLEVNADGRYVVLDEFVPAIGAVFARPGRRVYVRARLSGVTVSFGSTVDAVEGEGGHAYYRVPFPDALEYLQRRDSHRVVVPLEKEIPVLLIAENDTRLSCELRDLSLSGLSARLKPGSPCPYQVGDVIPRCIVDLDGINRIQGSLEVRYRELATEVKRAKIGGRLFEVDRRSERVLENLIAAMDREQTKKGVLV